MNDEEPTPVTVIGKLSDADRARARGFRYTILARASDGNEMELGECEGAIVADSDDEFALALQSAIVQTLFGIAKELNGGE